MPGTLILPDAPSVIDATVTGDDLAVTLSDGLVARLPLRFVYRFHADYPIGPEAELFVLPHLPRIEQVFVSDKALTVYLVDGRILATPLAWFPRLVLATPSERSYYELRGDDQIIHWPSLDEDIDLEGLLTGGRSYESTASLQRWLAGRPAAAGSKAAVSVAIPA